MSFFKHFFIGFIVIATLGASLNWLADPYSIYNPPLINHLNTEKSPGAPRFFKPLQASFQQPDIVFLGSSRVQVGLDPASIPNSYNFGIPGLKASELLGYGQHILTDTNASRLIIGLDFFTFDDSQTISGSYSQAVLGKNSLLRAIPETLFSFNSLNHSRKTFRSSYKGKLSLHQKNGFYQLPMPSDRPPGEIVLDTIQQFISTGGAYQGQKNINRSLSDLNRLLELANSKEVAVDLFISPTHAALMEALDMVKLWSVYENWKLQLTKLAAIQNVALWDFGGYTQLTKINLSSSQTVFFDGSHYLQSIGRRLLLIIDNKINSHGIGQLLTPDNIHEYLGSQHKARKEYRIINAADIERVRDVVCPDGCR